MPDKKIKIVIVDDHPLVLEGLKGLLSQNKEFELIAAFDHPQPFLKFIENGLCDVILMDVNLPDIKGPQLCSQILALRRDIKVIAVSNHNEVHIIQQMSKAGAKGYALKNIGAKELDYAITSVYGGKIYFSTDVQQILFSDKVKEDKIHLTRREKEVLKLIAEGLTTQQIADSCFVSPLTIESHRRNLMQKFKVNNSPALVRFAFEHRLI